MNPHLFTLPLANMAEAAPVFASVFFFMIPIVAILTKHQQKMAMILNDRRDQNSMPAIQSDPRVLTELSQLRELVHQQTIMIDDLATQNREMAEKMRSDSVRERLTQG